MSNEMKMSLQNGLTIAGLIAACGISYSALNGRVKSNQRANEKQDVRIEKLEFSEHQAALERQKNATRYENILQSNARIERFIASIEYHDIGESDAEK